MNKIFKYSLLKYRPSYLLNEQVNVGVLFVFLDDQKVVFRYPNTLHRRLSALYPDIDVKNIKQYLRAFEAKADKLSSKNLFVGVYSESIIENEFLIADANALFFSEFKMGTYGHISATNIINHFFSEYFSMYAEKQERNRKTEDDLVRMFLDGVKSSDKARFFKKEVSLSNDKVKAIFDICWQNGTTNYAKALSFDLLKKQDIQHKAVQWFGEMVQLNDGNNLADKRFDFWLAEPTESDSFAAFDKAVKILEDIPQNKRIILENDLNAYIEQALATSKPLPETFCMN
jgi:hypothetical protein